LKPKTENRKPKTENRKPKTENRKPKTENRKPKRLVNALTATQIRARRRETLLTNFRCTCFETHCSERSQSWS